MLAESRTTAVDTLAAWHSVLAEVGALGDALCTAIDGGDIVSAIATMMQLRRVRTDVARIEPSTRNLDGVELEQIHDVRRAVARSQGVHGVMSEWLGRSLPADAELLASALGVAVLADAILPAAWDFERDLVVLVGGELAPVAELLSDVGQRRIILVGEVGEVAGSVIVVRSVEELVIATQTMIPISPTQLTLRAAASADPELVDKCATAARNALGDLRIQQNTVRSFSRTWIEQGATNLPQLARWPTIDAIGERFAGVPMIIVAPGPSLAKNVGQLRALHDRAIICCFSHSLKPVLAAGVKPHLIVSVDPQDVRYHFAGCDVRDSFVVNGATVHPALFELPARGALTLASNGPLDEWLFQALGAIPQATGGGSVATTAFALALAWRCDPIVVVGLDLSFSGGQYYVATSSDGDARAEIDADGKVRVAGWSEGFTQMKSQGGPAAVAERVLELPGWHGDRVPTSFSFAMFHRWFVDTMRGVTGCSVYNCTEGGAWIEGMQHVPLAEVSPLLASHVDVGGILDATIAATDAAARQGAVARNLRSQISQLRRARKLALHARKLARHGGGGREHQLQRAERALAASLRPIEFASLLAQRELERALDIAAHDGERASYLEASLTLFDTVVRVADQLLPILAAAQMRLEAK